MCAYAVCVLSLHFGGWAARLTLSLTVADCKSSATECTLKEPASAEEQNDDDRMRRLYNSKYSGEEWDPQQPWQDERSDLLVIDDRLPPPGMPAVFRGDDEDDALPLPKVGASTVTTSGRAGAPTLYTSASVSPVPFPLARRSSAGTATDVSDVFGPYSDPGRSRASSRTPMTAATPVDVEGLQATLGTPRYVRKMSSATTATDVSDVYGPVSSQGTRTRSASASNVAR